MRATTYRAARAADSPREPARFTSPVELRYAREELELHGVRVGRGEMVLGVIASANRDAAHIADPHRLDLARQPTRHLAFGIGAHDCPGAPRARLETQIAPAALLERARGLRLAVAPDAPRWRRHAFLRGPGELPVAFCLARRAA